MTKRPRNPRVVAVELLRELKRSAESALMTWTVSGKVYIMPADQKPGDNAYLRKREPEEYPENQTDAWANLYAWAVQMEGEIADIKRHAGARYRALVEAEGEAK